MYSTCISLCFQDCGVSVGCLSEARFLLMYTSLLTSDHQPSSLSALANSGLIALLQTLLQLAGPDQADSEAVPEEEMQVVLTSQKRKNTSTLAEMAAAIKPGCRVVRGPNWKWHEQDGPPPSRGTVISELGEDGWVRVQWDCGNTNSYRMGKASCYDLMLVEMTPGPDNDEEDDASEIGSSLEPLKQASNRHPTALLKRAAMTLLSTCMLSFGLHGAHAQTNAVSTMCGHLRRIVQGANGQHTGLK